MALSDSLVDASDALVQNAFLVKIVTAIIILLVGFIIGKLAGKLIQRLLKELEFDKTLKKATGYNVSYSSFLSKGTSYFIYFLAVLISLESLGLTPFVLEVISVILLLIIAISIVLAIKDFIPNFIAGYTLRRKNLFKVGDRIKVGAVEGNIIEINLLDTKVETRREDLIVVPNAYFIKNMVIKKSH